MPTGWSRPTGGGGWGPIVATNLIDADRNRPENLVRPLAEPDDAATRDRERAAGRELLSQKKPPAEVAELVVDAIRANRFWRNRRQKSRQDEA